MQLSPSPTDTETSSETDRDFDNFPSEPDSDHAALDVCSEQHPQQTAQYID